MALPILSIFLSASTEGFETALNRAVRSAATASQQIGEHAEKINKAYERTKAVLEAAAAAFAIEKFAGLIEGSIQASAQLEQLSKRTGIAVETLGGLAFAAKQSGVDAETAVLGFSKLDKAIASALSGNKEAIANFQAVGISLQQLKNSSPDQIFIALAGKFASYSESAVKSADATDFFGKRGQALLPVLDQGSQKLQEAIDYYNKYSGVTADVTAKAEAFHQTQTKLSLLTQAFGNQLTVELLPALQGIASEFLKTKENSALFKEAASDVATILKGVATAATYVVEYLGQVEQRIGAVAASASAAVSLFSSSTASEGDIGQIGIGETADRVSEQQKAVVALRAIWEAQGEDAAKLSARMESLRQAINGTTAAAKEASGEGGGDNDAPNLNKVKKAVDPLVAYLDSLNKEGLKFKFDTDNFDRFKGAVGTSKAALVEFDVEFGKFSDTARTQAGLSILSDAQKKQVIDAGNAVAKFAEQLERVKALHAFDDSVKQIQLQASLVGQTSEQVEIATRLYDLEKSGIKAGTDEYAKRIPIITAAVHQLAIAQQLQQVKAFTFTGNQDHDEALFQLSLIGKTKDEVQDLTAARQIDLSVIRQAYDETGKQQVSDETLAQLNAEASRRKAQLAIDNTDARNAQRSALTGAKDFFNEYVATANDAASQIKEALTDAFSAAEDAFVQFATTGKLSFAGLATAIESDIAKIGFKYLASQGIQALQGAVGADSGLGKALSGVAGAAGNSGASSILTSGASLAGSSAALTTFSTTVAAANAPMLTLTTNASLAAAALARVAASGTGSSISGLGSLAGAAGDSSDVGDFASAFELFSAKGNVFAGGNVLPFARGGIVTAPTFFPMKSGGVGLMGEAGPEAIVPLRRGRDGSLGIANHGGGGGGGGGDTYVTNNINVPAPRSRDLSTPRQHGETIRRALGR